MSVVAAGCLAAALLSGTASASTDRYATVEASSGRVAPGSTLVVSGVCQHEWPPGPNVGAAVNLWRPAEIGSGKSWRSAFEESALDADRRYSIDLTVPADFVPDRYSIRVLCYGGDAIYATATSEVVVTGEDRRPTFADVPASYLHREAISELAAADVVRGCGGGRFCPNDEVSRAQFASLVARQLGLDGKPTTFSDVPSGSTHAGAIGALQAAGLVVGCTADRFCPGRPLRRDEAATLLFRATDRTGRAVDLESHDGFVDVPASSAHWKAVHILASDGDIRGCSQGRFCPSTSLTRAQAARLLHRSFSYGD
jgi:hypothetical protein